MIKKKGQQYFNLDDVAWREFGGVTRGVLVKDVSTRTSTKEFSLSLFKVEPDGEFLGHKHSHAHVIYVGGKGECWVGPRSYPIKLGDVALVRRKKSMVTETRNKRIYYFSW